MFRAFHNELVWSLSNLRTKFKTHPNYLQKLLKNGHPPSHFHTFVQSQAVNPKDGGSTTGT